MVRYHLMAEQRHIAVYPCIGICCHSHHHVAVHCVDAVSKVGPSSADKLTRTFGMWELERRQAVGAAGLIVRAGRRVGVRDRRDVDGLDGPVILEKFDAPRHEFVDVAKVKQILEDSNGVRSYRTGNENFHKTSREHTLT